VRVHVCVCERRTEREGEREHISTVLKNNLSSSRLDTSRLSVSVGMYAYVCVYVCVWLCIGGCCSHSAVFNSLGSLSRPSERVMSHNEFVISRHTTNSLYELVSEQLAQPSEWVMSHNKFVMAHDKPAVDEWFSSTAVSDEQVMSYIMKQDVHQSSQVRPETLTHLTLILIILSLGNV